MPNLSKILSIFKKVRRKPPRFSESDHILSPVDVWDLIFSGIRLVGYKRSQISLLLDLKEMGLPSEYTYVAVVDPRKGDNKATLMTHDTFQTWVKGYPELK